MEFNLFENKNNEVINFQYFIIKYILWKYITKKNSPMIKMAFQLQC